MSYDVSCSSCGHRNPLGRLYCMSCGAKLKVSEKSVAQARMTSEPGRGAAIWSGLRVLLTLGLLVVLIQLLRPVAATGQLGNRTDANELGRKLLTLKDAGMENRASEQVLMEPELNAYLAEILQRSPESGRRWFGFDLKVINLRLLNNRVVVVLRAEKGSVQLTQEIQAIPVRKSDGGWTCQITAMRVGHLPMPLMLAKGLAARSAGVFNGVDKERQVLERSASLDIKTGQMRVATTGS